MGCRCQETLLWLLYTLLCYWKSTHHDLINQVTGPACVQMVWLDQYFFLNKSKLRKIILIFWKTDLYLWWMNCLAMKNFTSHKIGHHRILQQKCVGFLRIIPWKWIKRKGAIDWPTRSSDLTPMDFFSVGICKRHFLCKKPDNNELMVH